MFAIRSRRKVCELKVWVFESVFLRDSENKLNIPFMGGTPASWLVRLTVERAVRVWALAGDILLFLGKTLLSQCLSPPRCINGYRQIVRGNQANKLRGVTCDGLASCPWEVEILQVASCYRNRDKLRQLWASLGSQASPPFPHTNYYKGSFSYSATILGNSLPCDIREAESLRQFKCLLKRDVWGMAFMESSF